LTKSLGTGLLATAIKQGELGTDEASALYASMCKLNNVASRAALSLGLQCATDVTGFGLLGHASHIAAASGVSIRIRVSQLPLLPGAEAAWQRGIRTGGAERNTAFLESRVDYGTATEFERAILVDPQTSGGLLVAMPAARVADYLSLVPEAVEIGEVIAREAHGLVLA
jgi:selenide,water dikinase